MWHKGPHGDKTEKGTQKNIWRAGELSRAGKLTERRDQRRAETSDVRKTSQEEESFG